MISVYYIKFVKKINRKIPNKFFAETAGGCHEH